MTKEELINTIITRADVSRSTALRTLDAVTDAIELALRRGDPVTLTHFGNFKVSRRPAREGRDPRNGNPIHIPATATVKFTPSRRLKEMLPIKPKD